MELSKKLYFSYKKKIVNYIYKKIFKKKTAIAFSGGIDSSILLNICKKNKKIIVIHVNHNLNKNSIKWAKHCMNISKKYNLKFVTINLKIKKKHIKKFGMEGAARIYRYSKISKYMKKKKIKNLITAHHLNDCIETYILKFFRGCSLRSLSMEKKKKKIFNLNLFRPFLYTSKKNIVKFFGKPKKFLKDPSNNDIKIKRNLIRYLLNKFIYKNFPKFSRIVLRNIENFKEEIKLLNKIAINDIKKTKMLFYKVSKLDKKRIKNLIIFLFKKKKIEISSKRWLNELIKQIKSFKKKMIVKKKGVIIFVKNNYLIIDENISP